MKNYVCNMVAAINNSQAAKKSYVIHFRKKICENILNVLWDEGFILGYKILKTNPNKIKIFLKYKNGAPSIKLIKRLSKPGLKIYYSVKQLWKLNSNNGVIILSTNKGFLSDINCKKKTIGGEPFIIVK